MRFAEFVPYVVRFLSVAEGDLSDPDGAKHFHVCSRNNGLGDLDRIDDDRASFALAALTVRHVLPGEAEISGLRRVDCSGSQPITSSGPPVLRDNSASGSVAP